MKRRWLKARCWFWGWVFTISEGRSERATDDWCDYLEATDWRRT